MTGGDCPFEVTAPVMVQRWERLTFLHWSYEPDVVQRLLPPWLTVETWEDRAWVGVVPFFMRVATPTGHALPWASNFCETNVRTYVRDEMGTSAIWFFSLDAARFGAVVLGRTVYGLPYFWSQMRLIVESSIIRYECQRRWPSPRGISTAIEIEVGEPFSSGELTAFDDFLTTRWVLFSDYRGRRRLARANHPRWPLRRASARHVSDELLTASGVPPPTGEPVVHYSPGVSVRVGRPERAG